MKESQQSSGDRVEEPGLPGESTRSRARGSTSKRYGVAERQALLAELASSGETMAVFCKRHGVSTATVCAWKRALRAHGEAGLVPREPRRNASGRTGRVRSADERRAAVEAFERSQMKVDDFARTFGVSPSPCRQAEMY